MNLQTLSSHLLPKWNYKNPVYPRMSGSSVEVGFTDPLNNPLLFSPEHFPSKVGGHPAWLNPSNLPAVPLCSICGDPLVFFAQIYAGLYDVL